jgi:hypothetical protein
LPSSSRLIDELIAMFKISLGQAGQTIKQRRKDATTITATTIRRKPTRLGKASWRLGAARVLLCIWTSLTLMVSLFHYRRTVVVDDYPTGDAAAGRQGVVRRSSRSSDNAVKEFVLWSPRETYFEDCRQTMIRNTTWGAARAPFVDKIQAKHLAREWSSSVAIIPTLAIYDETNISSLVSMDTLQRLPQPFVVKSAHLSGGVAVVQNDTYRIVKSYRNIVATTSRLPLSSTKAKRVHRQLVNVTMAATYSANHGEMQYANVPRRMLVEPALNMSRFRDVTYWYMANGTPLFASLECTMGDPDHRAWRSARFGVLPMQLTSPGCNTTTGPPRRPHSWEKMRTIAMELTRHIPGVVRVDCKLWLVCCAHRRHAMVCCLPHPSHYLTAFRWFGLRSPFVDFNIQSMPTIRTCTFPNSPSRAPLAVMISPRWWPMDYCTRRYTTTRLWPPLSTMSSTWNGPFAAHLGCPWRWTAYISTRS